MYACNISGKVFLMEDIVSFIWIFCIFLLKDVNISFLSFLLQGVSLEKTDGLESARPNGSPKGKGSPDDACDHAENG